MLDGKKNFAIFAKMGAGKTAIALLDAQRLYSAYNIDCVLITAPSGVTTQWIREQAPKWLTCKWVCIEYISKSRRSKHYVDSIMDAYKVAKSGALLVVVIHFEALSLPDGQLFVEKLMRSIKTCWIIDESTKIKNPRVKRSKSVHILSKWAEYRRILTGTPVTKGIEDLWSQMKFLDENILGKSFYAFRARYCELEPVRGAPAGAVKIVGYKKIDELTKRIAPFVFQTSGLDMPSKTYMTRYVDLTDEQITMYDYIKKILSVIDPDDPIIDVQNALSQMVAMQRVVCGHYADINGTTKFLGSNRANAVADIIEESDDKVIVWHRFSADAVLIRAAIEKRYKIAGKSIGIVEYSGKINKEDRISAIDAIRTDPNVCVMIAQIQSASHGLDIPQVGISVYYSGTFDAEARWQSENRQRPGLIHPGVYVDVISNALIDQMILENNKRKLESAELVREFIKKTKASN